MDAHAVLSSWDGERPAVLATIVEARGHSYRKPGACMLLGRGGWKRGSLSPGCLEADLEARAEALLDMGSSPPEPTWERVLYEMESPDDLMWGEAIGCGGTVTVLLERVEGELASCIRRAAAHNGGTALHLERMLGSSGRAIEYRLLEASSLAVAGIESDGAGHYSFPIHARPRLILFGAGADSLPVARLAEAAGFRLAVADWREELCTAERYPGAQLALGTADSILRELSVGPADYVFICSHQLQRDRAMLELLSPCPLRYIGILGSRKRVAALLDGLLPAAPVFAPVGLDIGADGPVEIAVSVVAELIAVRRLAEREAKPAARTSMRPRRMLVPLPRDREAVPLGAAGGEAGFACPVEPGRT
ncbi:MULTISPECIES: XdhC/CoxI family protein [unclassified Paenibacillus]|uniref:XdhC family protein n=1 Tax=unclassified Paenibacillus TaxID=185978 RepID=UPI0009543EC6|nr:MULTISPECIES: XdhC/CoxI family protein [unclassified Paenibacillus]ASS66837.2 XdhC family protein [Paenibacillus sp. RUD330]SIP93818.1 xanthine dehydrogenase accessory factor [Paenibacillus sp. RU4X]SIQ12342.1 xanthine dehydrogenase accessory factor [Paenibacillus sp. RU4T]